MMLSDLRDYILVTKIGLANLKTVIQLLKAINFKEVQYILFYVFSLCVS